jgi:hypothetical protein
VNVLRHGHLVVSTSGVIRVTGSPIVDGDDPISQVSQRLHDVSKAVPGLWETVNKDDRQAVRLGGLYLDMVDLDFWGHPSGVV